MDRSIFTHQCLFIHPLIYREKRPTLARFIMKVEIVRTILYDHVSVGGYLGGIFKTFDRGQSVINRRPKYGIGKLTEREINKN